MVRPVSLTGLAVYAFAFMYLIEQFFTRNLDWGDTVVFVGLFVAATGLFGIAFILFSLREDGYRFTWRPFGFHR